MDTPPVIWPTVACTAHRIQFLTPQQQDWSRHHLLRAACWFRDLAGTTVGVSGMAVGGDLWWADAVVKAGLTLAAHMPYRGQTAKWRDSAARREHARLVALADPALSRVVSAEWNYGALDQRNLGMLDVADALVAVWKPSMLRGGTFRALCEAARRGMPGVHIDPENLKVTFQLPDPRRAGGRTRVVADPLPTL